MNGESFNKLLEELKKFSGFRFPDEIKSAVSESISQNYLKSIKFPISSTNSPIVKSISLILSNKKINPIPQIFVLQICDCIGNGIFSGQALVTIIKSMEMLTETDDMDFSLKLIQFASSSLPFFSSNLPLIKSFSSIILSFLNSKHETVVNAAFAAFQQMISIEFNFIQTSKLEDLSRENQQNLKILSKNGISARFDDPLYVIGFLIVNDLANLTIGKQCLWLKVQKIPLNILFNLWTSLISTQSQFLKKSIHMLRVIENSAISQNPSILPLEFHVSFVRSFYKELKTSSISLFSQYLAGLSIKSELYDTSILFFRTLLTQKPTFLMCIFHDNSELIAQLLEKLNALIDVKSYQKAIELKFQQLKPTPLLLKQTDLFPMFILETSLLSVSCLCLPDEETTNDSNQSILELATTEDLEIVWRKMISLMIKLVRLCAKNSCENVFRVLSNLIHRLNPLLNEGNKDRQLILLRILCSLVSQQKILQRKDIDPLEAEANDLLHTNKSGFWFKGKRVFAYHVLQKTLEHNPEYFIPIFKRVFNALSLYENSSLDANWTQNVHDNELKSLTQALLTNSPFSINFLKNVFINNSERFEIIWNVCSEQLPQLIQNQEIENSILDLLSKVNSTLFSQNNETMILKTINQILEKDKYKISINVRLGLMDMLQVILKHNGNSIIKGWPFIISAISVENCDNSVNVLSSAFQVLNGICTDHLHKLTDDDLSHVITLVISFCSQKADLNTALTALGLHWNIISFVYSSSKYWKQILSLMMNLFNDPRNDVSSGALSTFFMLLTSNAQQMPDDVLPHLLEMCLIPLLSSYESFDESNYTVVQHALCEIGHCACSFWEQFDKIPSFRKTFCPLLIQRVYLFLSKCTDPDITSNCLQFYEDSFPSPVFPYTIRMEMLKSMSNIISLFLSREAPNSLVISEVGKLIQRSLPTQKDYLSNEMLNVWLQMIIEICLTLPAENNVNITSQKCLQAILQLLPLEDELLKSLVNALSQIVIKTTKRLLMNMTIQILIKAFNEIPKESQLIVFLDACSPLYHLNQASSLIKAILEYENVIKDKGDKEEISKLFHVLLNIKKNSTEIEEFIDTKLVELILDVSVEDQLEYIKSNKLKTSILLLLWTKYCDPTNSESYSAEFSENCFPSILSFLSLFVESGNMKVLEFIEKANVTKQDYGPFKDCSRWHLHSLLHSITQLLNDGREDVINIARKLIKLVNEDLTAMLQ